MRSFNSLLVLLKTVIPMPRRMICRSAETLFCIRSIVLSNTRHLQNGAVASKQWINIYFSACRDSPKPRRTYKTALSSALASMLFFLCSTIQDAVNVPDYGSGAASDPTGLTGDIKDCFTAGAFFLIEQERAVCQAEEPVCAGDHLELIIYLLFSRMVYEKQTNAGLIAKILQSDDHIIVTGIAIIAFLQGINVSVLSFPSLL